MVNTVVDVGDEWGGGGGLSGKIIFGGLLKKRELGKFFIVRGDHSNRKGVLTLVSTMNILLVISSRAVFLGLFEKYLR